MLKIEYFIQKRFHGQMNPLFDSFFSLFRNSGFLVTLLFLRTKSSTKQSGDGGNGGGNSTGSFISGTKQSVMFVIYRYVRLTPVYFMVIFINAVTLK